MCERKQCKVNARVQDFTQHVPNGTGALLVRRIGQRLARFEKAQTQHARPDSVHGQRHLRRPCETTAWERDLSHR